MARTLAQPLSTGELAAAKRAAQMDADTVREVYDHTARIVRLKLKGTAARSLTEDAQQAAALLALAMLGDDEQPRTAKDAAPLAAYTAARIALAEHRDQAAMEAAAGDTTALAIDLEQSSPRARLEVGRTARPDALALPPTMTAQASAAFRTLEAARPDLAEIVRTAAALPAPSGMQKEQVRTWRNGLPAARPMLEATGAKDTGRNRAAMARTVRLAFHAWAEHTYAQAERLHAAADTVHYGNKRTPAAASHRSRCTPEAAALAAAAVEHSTGGKYGKPATEPTSGPASACLTETPEPRPPFAPQPLRIQHQDGTRTALDDAKRGEVLATLTLPAYSARKPAAEALAVDLDASTDAHRPAPAVAGVSPANRGMRVGNTTTGHGTPPKAPAPRKRRRDGAIGGSMTRA